MKRFLFYNNPKLADLLKPIPFAIFLMIPLDVLPLKIIFFSLHQFNNFKKIVIYEVGSNNPD